MKNNFGDTKNLVEVQEIKQNTVILKDGSLRQIIIVGGINFALKSEEEQNIILEAYRSFLNSLEFPIQILIHSRKINIENYIEILLKRREEEPSLLLKNQIEEYIEFVRGFVHENAIMNKTFFVIVPFTPISLTKETKKLTSKIQFLRKKPVSNQNQNDVEEEFKHNINQLNQRTARVVEGLISIGLDALVLDNDSLLELFYNFYNPETIEKERFGTNK